MTDFKQNINSLTLQNHFEKLLKGDNLDIFCSFVSSNIKMSKNIFLTKDEIKIINRRFGLIEKSNTRSTSNYVESFIKTYFNEAPESFENESKLNLISNLFYAKKNPEPFVLFNHGNINEIKDDPLFRKLPSSKSKYYLVSLIFNKKIQPRSPILYIEDRAHKDTIKDNKYPSVFRGNYAEQNGYKTVYLRNFSEFYIQYLMENKGTMDFSSKGARLHFIRKYICNYSQNEFSNKLQSLGIKTTSSTVARWEKDTAEIPLWYKKYRYMITDTLQKSDNIFGLLSEHYGYDPTIHDEVIEDFIDHDDVFFHRNTIDPIFQILEKNTKNSKDQEELKKEFSKNLKAVSYINTYDEEYELTSMDVQYLIQYLKKINKRSFFSDMKISNFNEENMFKLFKIWKKIGTDSNSTD